MNYHDKDSIEAGVISTINGEDAYGLGEEEFEEYDDNRLYEPIRDVTDAWNYIIDNNLQGQEEMDKHE